MRIAKSTLVRPGENSWYGTFAVALSVFIFAYSARFGQVSVLVFYALWLPLVLVDYRHVIGNYSRFSWILAFGLFACLSFTWSAAPSVTLRAGIQYMTTIICALIASRVIDSKTFASGVSLGVGVVLLYSLAFGRYHYDPLDGSYSFVGAFSSKNQLGFFASLGLYFVFASFFVLRTSIAWRCIAVPLGGLSAYCLLASSSATSIIATLATFMIIITVGLVLKFSPRNRRAFFIVGLVIAVAVAAVALNAGAVNLILGAFGKDTTLTGRTYLWDQGLRAAQESPLIGVGYYAYWVQGFSEAERLWDEFYIGSRSGFHFHNTYIEVLVELGYVGLVLISLVMVRVLLGYLKRLLTESYTPQAHLMFGIAILLLIRSFFEIDFITPYTIGAFLLYYSAGILAIPQRNSFTAVQPQQQTAVGATPG
ncbi:exopolysaccharide biosynthesis protein [Phyllobacterium phragmitis]|uniref:Exopolysaccharide biosynthesis protein n=1 Tax=Phyllobacterium phragmitis TaxID=2670329 RepID=A0A2S9IPU6_9HYPH|nr:O-antigen ligase [Phyllobacterium phragmitis]PRD42547.1 exopolysaccharide biosynthesis protein [Phyllobacterium phragmitis]